MSPQIELQNLLFDIQSIEDELRRFERKYRLRSAVFYSMVMDGTLEQSEEFIKWLGLYEILQRREKQYADLASRTVSTIAPYINAVAYA
ncbi:MAG: hypothetical protein DRI77_11705 [Chloroflexi bacterium]|nr:MAG: hypothetical protein DRI77_11705 [Chloroflexota bacterium]